MAVARQNEIQERLGRLEKEVAGLQRSGSGAGIVSEYRAASAVTLPIILSIIAVVGGSNYLLNDRFAEVHNRIDDTNNLIRDLKSDLEKDIDRLESRIDGIDSRIDGIDAKLDRLLLR